MKIIIPGKPIAKARPRFARRGKFTKTYSAQETEESKFYMLAKRQIKEPLSGPLMFHARFVFARPKSHFGTGKNAGKLKPSAPFYHTQTIDLDNLCKFALDCLQGLAFENDSHIVGIRAEKEYGAEARTEIMLFKFDDLFLREGRHGKSFSR